jgi:hypothetical protein
MPTHTAGAAQKMRQLSPHQAAPWPAGSWRGSGAEPGGVGAADSVYAGFCVSMRIPFGNEYAYGVRSMHGIVA